MQDTLAHTQLSANCEKLGGWDNTQAVADAIEAGDIKKTEELVQPYPQAYELVERIITVSAQYR
jgi:iron uptake system EfeUOB component EfeO/EfeM